MTKNPPNRRGITFEVGAQLEARDRLKKWYAAHIEEIDYEEGKVLIHFKRWNHRYDEWFCWDSPYLRPLEKIQLRREGLVEEDPQVIYRVNEHVLACWSDCRFYPAKITAINKDGTYTVKFFDGVVQTVKNIHVKASSKDQANLSRTKQREKVDNTSSSDKHRGTFWEQKKSTENTDLQKVKSSASGQKPPAPSEKKLLFSERTKLLEKNPVKKEKEDKENISENEREHSVDPQCEERAAQNDTLKASQENGEIRKKVCMSSSSSMPSGSSSHSLQPVTLELRRRKISIEPEIQSKRPRLDKKKNSSDEKVEEKNEKGVLDDEQKAATEDIRGNEDNEHLVQYMANGTLHIMADNPLPPPAQEESFEELVSASNQSKEVYRNLSSASTQEPTEAKEASEPESIMKSRAADLFMDSADIPEKEQSLQNNSEATTVTDLPKLHDLLSERRHSTPAPMITCLHRQSLREKSQEKEIQKVYPVPDRLSVGVSDKAREKSKDSFNPKSKKKRKKKRSKSELSGSEENIDIQKAPSLKKTALAMPNHDFKSQFPLRNPLLRSLDPGLQRDAAKISDEDTLSDSCTESLLWSDEDYNEEIDVTNADEEDGDCEIVRCICEVQEENDFMIQCEDCLCWQHGLCMGLLEDNIPERYSCYICQDPPGQRLSLKYWYDKEWLNKGYMHGLPFLEENYSHQNAKKIVSTHQLLGDIQRVIEVLHGLQLKIGILQSKEHQDMNYWGQPWKHMLSDKCYIRCSSEEACKEDSTNYRTYNGETDKPPPLPAMEESYITSEHCYQKPRTYYPAVEQRLVVETRSSALDAGVQQIRQSREDSIAERLGWELDRELIKSESESKHNYCKVRECLTKRNPSQESSKPLDNGDATINKQIQWQLNLLAHLESLQDEVTHRMDFIEKELDVLESFLDYTGELEPPEPLARLPQLKHRIKQLLMDLGKVEQIALCYST